MTKTRLMMIGGFLGAGKTTAIARLARHYQSEGRRVAVVTNDQAFGLVDTGSLRSQGLAVGEVPGACFCCKFDELVDTLAALGADAQPDIILTEPVGSCTDLIATVIEPLRQLHGDRYEVGRLAVLCKPEHGRKILAAEANTAAGGFSPQAAYIFLKQLEEADLIVINKVDKIGDAEAKRLAKLVEQRFPQTKTLLASGKRGDGFTELLAELDQPRDAERPLMAIDYDTYAAGEAELAWLNTTAELVGSNPLKLDDAALAVVQQIASTTTEQGFEPAHIKALGYADGHTCVANLVSSGAAAEISVASGCQTNAARLVVNARVAGDPNRLATAVEEALDQVAATLGFTATVSQTQSFRPGRPEPTHRVT